MILGGGKNMLSSIFSLVEGILSSAGASAEAQNIVSTVFDSILKGIGIFWLIEPDDSKRRLPVWAGGRRLIWNFIKYGSHTYSRKTPLSTIRGFTSSVTMSPGRQSTPVTSNTTFVSPIRPASGTRLPLR